MTLTVTDDDGAPDDVSHVVTTTAPPPQAVLDTFTRNASSTWGTADVGGAWTPTGQVSRFGVNGNRGTITLTTGNVGSFIYLNGVSERDTNAVFDVSTNVAAVGSGISHSMALRRVGTSEYRGSAGCSPGVRCAWSSLV